MSSIAGAGCDRESVPSNRRGRKPSATPISSPADSGYSGRISMRPASDSDRRGRVMTLAEPVSRKRPGCRSRSTTSLIAGNSSGAFWISSMTTGPGRLRAKPAGSPMARASVAASSRVKYWAPAAAASNWASVVFPVCRAPLSSTTGVSDRASSMAAWILRLIMAEYSPVFGELARLPTRALGQAPPSARRAGNSFHCPHGLCAGCDPSPRGGLTGCPCRAMHR